MRLILFLGLTAPFFSFEFAYAHTKPVDEQIQEVKEVIQPRAPFPKTPAESTEGAVGCLECLGITVGTSRPPAKCDLKGARDDLKLLPKDWGLKATGADLLRDEPLMKNLKYDHALGIVDTGLKLRGNPEAGQKLTSTSPEEDAGIFHGSHVTGIAVSDAHGVNPYLATKVFPVGTNMGGKTTKSEDLLNSLEKAVDDKSTLAPPPLSQILVPM
ncbi:MAG TPA: hypothetical protein VIG33_15430 [Pseudobdellovibrionaceae bacterium]|jgi:hypothetical protein